MATPKSPDSLLIEALNAVALVGNTSVAARMLRIPRATLQGRLEAAALRGLSPALQRIPQFPNRLHFNIRDGVILVFSDAHYGLGEASTAHRALVHACRRMRPRALIANGDIRDSASTSRHPPLGWGKPPSVKAELEVCQERLDELAKAAGAGAKKIWLYGNHDIRDEMYLAANAPQFEGVLPTLPDHFPEWRFGMRLDINPGEDGHTLLKHRIKGGIHAAHNNTKDMGVHTVTSHLHRLNVAEWTDVRGTRYGCDTGTLSEIVSDHAEGYTESATTGWRSGFLVLTFRRGQLLHPEKVEVSAPGVVQFRGQEYDV